MQTAELINAIEPSTVNEQFKIHLTARISDLVQNDFPGLVHLLYRLDISEKKLKQVIQGHPVEDNASVITELIIERQLEKLQLRKQFPTPDDDIPAAERW